MASLKRKVLFGSFCFAKHIWACIWEARCKTEKRTISFRRSPGPKIKRPHDGCQQVECRLRTGGRRRGRIRGAPLSWLRGAPHTLGRPRGRHIAIDRLDTHIIRAVQTCLLLLLGDSINHVFLLLRPFSIWRCLWRETQWSWSQKIITASRRSFTLILPQAFFEPVLLDRSRNIRRNLVF